MKNEGDYHSHGGERASESEESEEGWLCLANACKPPGECRPALPRPQATPPPDPIFCSLLTVIVKRVQIFFQALYIPLSVGKLVIRGLRHIHGITGMMIPGRALTIRKFE